MPSIFPKYNVTMLAQRSLCRDNEYRHRLIFEQFVDYPFWKKNSLLDSLDFKCYDMSVKGALYRVTYWGREIAVRMPENKVAARMVLQRLRGAVYAREACNGDISKRGRVRLEAQGFFDIPDWIKTGTLTHDIKIDFGSQLSQTIESIQALLTGQGMIESLVDTVVDIIVKFTLFMKINLQDWMAVSAWMIDALRSFGVRPTMILGFLSTFRSSGQKLEAQIATPLDWLHFVTAFFSMAIFKAVPSVDLIARIVKTGNFSRGILSTWQLFEKFMKDGLPIVYKYFTKRDYHIEQAAEHMQEISKWYDAVQKLISLDVLDSLAVSEETCVRVESLYREGLKFLSRAEELNLEQRIQRAIETHFNVVKLYYDRVQASGAFKCSPKVEPLVIHLHGAPGVGKSGMMYPLAIELLKLNGMTDGKWAEEIYTRNVNQEFWDGYRNQTVCLYDDFGQMKDSATNPNDEFMEIIKTANLAPYNLHMASLQDKARTYFNSKVVILSSNTAWFNPQSLTHPEAVRRRIDVSVCVSVKPEFRKRGSQEIDGVKVARAFNGSSLVMDIYELAYCDAFSGHIIDVNQKMSYGEFLEDVKTKFDLKMNRSQKVLAALNALALQAQMENEDFVDANESTDVEFLDLTTLTPNQRHRVYELYIEQKTFIPQERDFAEIVTLFFKKEVVEQYRRFSDIFKSLQHPITWPKIKHVSLPSVVSESFERCRNAAREAREAAKGYLEKTREVLDSYPILKALIIAVPLVGFLFAGIRHARRDARAELSNSGDVRTARGRRHKAELSRSGDSRTAKTKSLKTELAGSGDSKTAKQRIMRTESAGLVKKCVVCFQQDAVDLMCATCGTIKPEVDECDFTAELQSDENAFQLSKKLVSNVYTITVLKEERVIARMKGMFVRGRIFLTAAHLVPSLKRGDTVRLTNAQKKRGFTIPVSSLRMSIVKGKTGEEKDQVLIDVSRLVHDHADVVPSMMSSLELGSFTACKGVLITPADSTTCLRYGNVVGRDQERIYASNEGDIRIRQHYEYSLETSKGDCGSPLVAINPLLSKKILGIHVAGGVGIGIASPLNQSQIVETLKAFEQDAQVIFESQNWVADLNFPEEARSVPSGDFTFLGKAHYQEVSPKTSAIVPSLIQGQVTEPITKPSQLSLVQVDGETIDPMLKGLEKCAVPSAALNEHFLQAAVNDVRKNFKQDPARQRVLSNQEMLEGVAGDEFSTPVRRSTSAGYPFKRLIPGPGKTVWCGKDEDYILHPLLERKIEQRVKEAKMNIRHPTIWVDTLKDERRPLEKVQAGKTRVFSAGPVDYILAARKYFLGFAAHCAANRNWNEVSVGTNVYSTDWDVLASLLQTHGTCVIAGDFSNFDGTLHVLILHTICDLINDWYDDGEENAQVRRMLWRELVNSVHLCGCDVYMWTHSQPSGNPLTAILNSVYNSIVCRYVWMVVTQGIVELHNMSAFSKNVKMAAYGDDNVLNVSYRVIDVYNQVTMAEAFKTIGMTYTDESKSGSMVPYRTLPEVSYLKRGFVYDNEWKCWRAPLDLKTILEIPNWVRKCVDEEDACRSNVEDACTELALHGAKVFEHWAPQFKKATRGFRCQPQILTFHEYIMSEVFNKASLFTPIGKKSE